MARRPDPWLADPSEVEAVQRELRRHGRLRTEAVTCSLGRVLNLSASGLRVRCDARPPCRVGQKFVITIVGLEGPFQVSVRPVWIKRVGFFKFEVGASFEDLDESARIALLTLARNAVSTLPRDPD